MKASFFTNLHMTLLVIALFFLSIAISIRREFILATIVLHGSGKLAFQTLVNILLHMSGDSTIIHDSAAFSLLFYYYIVESTYNVLPLSMMPGGKSM